MSLFPIIDYSNEITYQAQKLLAEIQYCWSKRLLEHEMDLFPKLKDIKYIAIKDKIKSLKEEK